MKKTTILRRPYLVKVFSVLLLIAVVSSCKKKDELEVVPAPSTEKSDTNTASNESLIKFLSINLGVEKSEIVFNTKNDEFIVRGSLKFSRTEIANLYQDANVYQSTYGK